MARPRRDETPSRQPIKKKFTDAFIDGLRPDTRLLTVYDTHQRGLALTVQPKSGRKTWKAIYFAPGGRPRWYHIGAARCDRPSRRSQDCRRHHVESRDGRGPGSLEKGRAE
jgi:hypothetical protein